MNYLKGTAIDFIKFKFRSNQVLEEEFLALLDSETKSLYKRILPITRVKAETGAMIFEKASKILYPQSPQPIRQLGYEQAQHDLKGVYRVILKIVSIPYIIQKASQLWRTYHLQGDATVESAPDKNTGTMIVRNYPDISEAYLESTSGYIRGTLELAGAKNVSIQTSRQQEEARWDVKWE